MRYLVLLLIFFLSVTAAQAREVMSYDIYTGGLKTIATDLTVDISGSQYHLLMDGRTTGLADIFAEWKGKIETKGKMPGPAQARPLSHQSISIWPNNRQEKRIKWNAAGQVTDFSLLDEGETMHLDDIDKVMLRDAVDIVTASLSIMESVKNNENCETEKKVFDGKRSFTLRAKTIGWETLEQSRYNRFKGKAMKCEISIIPGQGDWHRKLKGWMSIQEQGEQAGAKPVVWLAPLQEGGAVVPVKMQAKTTYGAFMMHLTGYRPQ